MPSGQPLSRFVARAGVRKRTGMVMVLASLGVTVGLGMGLVVLPEPVRKVVVPVCVLLLLGGYGVFLARTMRAVKVTLDVADGRLLVDEGRGGLFPIAGALLGPWRMPGVGVVGGTILHLRDGERLYRIGGLDHRPAASLPLEASISDEADAYLSEADFDALLKLVLPSIGYRDRRGSVAMARCQLLKNPWLVRYSLGHLLPWFGAITLVMIVTSLLGKTGLFDTLSGQFMGLALILPIVAGGLVLSARRSLNKKSVLEIETDQRELRARDLKSGAITFAAPLTALSCTRGMRRYNLGRGGRFEHAVIAISGPGQETLTIGVADARFTWVDSRTIVPAPRYVVGSPDWNVLVEALGVGGTLRKSE